MLLLFLLFALLIPALAQDPPSVPAPLYGFAGRVVNALTGESVPRARVSFSQRATLTSPDGAFHFANVPAGEYAAVAEKPGYFAENMLPRSTHAPDTFTVGPQTPPLLVKLVPAAVITGSIRDQLGEPLTQIPVELFRRILQQGRFRWLQAGYAVSDEDGDFRLPDLMPETYLLRYGPHWTTSVFTAGKTQGYAAAYFPDAPAQAAAAPLKLTAGETLPLELALRPRTPITVSGTLAGAPENSYPEIQVFDEDGEEVPARDDAMFRRDRFTLHFAAPGAYTVRVTSRTPAGVLPQTLFGETTLAVNTSVTGVTIAMAPAPRFLIQVTANHVKPPAQVAQGGVIGAMIGDGAAPSQFRLIPLARNAENEYSSQWDDKTKTSSFPEVLPGAYHFDSSPQADSSYIASATLAGRDILNQPFQVGSGQSGAIDVTMRDDGATLTGSINGLAPPAPQPQGGVVYSLSPGDYPSVLLVADARPWSSQPTPAWQGNFQFSALAPGSYKLYAFDHIEDVEYMDPAVLEHYSARAVSLTFTPNEQKSTSIDLTHVNP